jgi:peptidoglycan/xylan/chitin deacetylase (PgdA/CDA1 family)
VLPLLAGLATGFHVSPALASTPAVRKRWPVRGPLAAVISKGRGREDHVALTFDDGPDAVGTPEILAVLDDLQVKATFFVLGEMVERHAWVLEDLVARGHEIGVHGWDHTNSLRRSGNQIVAGVGRTLELLATHDVHPIHYRPPYGVVTGGTLKAAREHGLRLVLWEAWGYDWAPDATPVSVLARLEPDLSGGCTVLLHDSDCTSSPGSWRTTLGTLRPLITDLRARGLGVGTLADHGLVSAR